MLLFYLSLVETPEEKSKVEKLYHQYGKLMKYIALKISKDEELAEDAVHDSFVIIIEHLHRIGDVEENRTKNFVAIIIRNVTLNLIAKKKRRAEMDLQAAEKLAHCRNELFDKIYAKEWIEKIEELPTIYRDPMQLKAQFGLKNKEIAEILEISISVVGKRLERARKILDKERDAENV